MRYALIMAGGSGTRLWPMSRARLPKQLIPFIGGRSLLQLAYDRLEPLIPAGRRYVCAAEPHARPILDALPALSRERLLGEPVVRDTLNAVGFSAAVLAKQDPEAVIAVFTADHLIEPVESFQRIVEAGLALVERNPATLVTFGIAPTGPVTAYGYLELGRVLDGAARLVDRFQEKPDAETARRYVEAGPERYLWNSGMFVWRAATLLDCIRRYEPEVHAGLDRIAQAWGTPRAAAVLADEYPRLKRISVDHAVMERASRDPAVKVAAVPMPIRWLDVGSWPSFARTCPVDAQGNAVATPRSLLVRTARTLVASSDPGHLVAVLGCEDLMVIHTPDATLVCRADQAEAIKEVHRRVEEQFGPGLV
jgi:mannose-1-phosphate guanylyltransferase